MARTARIVIRLLDALDLVELVQKTKRMEMINTHQAKTHLSRLLERVAAGEEFIIARAGKPIARLVGYHGDDRSRVGGHWKGLVRIGPDFDAPLPDEVEQAFRESS